MSKKKMEFPGLQSLLVSALGDALAPTEGGFLDLMSDDISFEFPYALPGSVTELTGKVALADYLPRVGELITVETLILLRAIVAPDKRSAVLEFAAKAYANETGARYDQDYISVIELRDGRISRYRDYWNPQVLIAALGDAAIIHATPKSQLADR
ncbi:nuclear transport factor 2 family protein [Qipengyuania qiaonensis]|uniref:Nuclear transport factor 2 family protein n=1 Tax=Qipengyuania qiaonensis TaxID=2867240 RepID=A0ABS7J9L8_9SPHN|nr:nuclear transport factor 2 family protein [Qipengyuania qiaonensis]MBX7482764.1 nuclear transport factor 2 family protein [Qipengyuania qiaonensis]